MAKKSINWKTKGMNRDTSVSAFNPEFAFENVNLRLATNDGNTMMSWVNEKGPKEITLTIIVNPWESKQITTTTIAGTAIGTAVINHSLVLFTTDTTAEANPDRIYVLRYSENNDMIMTGHIIFHGDLRFSVKYPLETLVSYEADYIQKVYWTDGRNQPRVINIAASDEKMTKWNYSGTHSKDTFFDFIPVVATDDLKVSITKNQSSGGTFAPGVIQYCFTYINKYGQQSNIVYTSTLYYLALSDRAASPSEKVTSSFSINIENVDSNFDYVRLYSIQRTSIDDTPIVKLLEDIPITATTENEGTVYKVSYVDSGVTGSSMDPTELLYVGGKEITALTMTEKDNTLFLGNINQKNVLIDNIQSYIDTDREKEVREVTIAFTQDTSHKQIPLKYSGSTYFYYNSLERNLRDITTFKGGETYRFGFQLQKKNGEWTEPIYLDDVTNELYPIESTSTVTLTYAKSTLNLKSIQQAYGLGFFNTFKRIRPVIVYPNISDRTVLCQGILNPTVFNVEDRMDNSPFAQASWFFRPYYSSADSSSTGSPLAFKHYDSIYSQYDSNESRRVNPKQIEIQGSCDIYESAFSTAISNPKSNTQYFVDQSILTLNSPDLEFDTETQIYGTENLHLRVIGIVPITSTASSHYIRTSSSMLETNYDSSKTDYTKTRIFGSGELNTNVIKSNYNNSSFQRLVSDYLWNDVSVSVTIKSNQTIIKTSSDTYNFLICPWQRTGPLNNDARAKAEATSYLEYKREANIWFSGRTVYFPNQKVDFSNIGVQIPLTENAEVMNYRLPSQKSNSAGINYYANIDKILVNGNGYNIIADGNNSSADTTDPISIKYKSTTHAVVSLGHEDGDTRIPILPYAIQGNDNPIYYGQYTGDGSTSAAETFWGNTVQFSQSSIKITDWWEEPEASKIGFLWLGEIYKDVDDNARFGGKGKHALLNNNWVPAGEDIEFTSSDSTVTLEWTEGDTFCQRYDCLKTYPFTEDDTNQIVEILSFMCETHVNIDGRYDRNRGQLNNLTMRPTNFNLLNPVYTQKNNFFTSRMIDTEDIEELNYPNQVFYTKTKESGADVDLWTNTTLSSMLELDGSKGNLTSLKRLNDNIIAFQDSGISQILYNENVQIASTAGVPIEIANSGKVQGKRYISSIIGCSNKWSISQTPSGIYFIDNNDKGIYLFNGQLNNISAAGGFNSWCKQNIPSSDGSWNPSEYDDFVTYYDKLNQDILFINKDTALAYSEKLGGFTSFYDYGSALFFENFDDTGVWIKDGKLWKHQAGDYCNFFGTNKPFSMTLIGNQEPLVDKIFTNMEFRANVENEGTYTEATESTTEKFIPTLPFDSLEAWDEYQHGLLTLTSELSYDGSKFSRKTHETDVAKSTLSRKYRIWRCNIPRDNASLDSDFDGIKRFKVRPLDRMRNPWVYLKLKKDAASEGSTLSKTEIHDIMAIYFG